MSNKPRAVGYIVVDENNEPMRETGGTLWMGTGRSGATIFRSRADATAALRRTRKYAIEQDLLELWRVDRWRLIALKEPRHAD